MFRKKSAEWMLPIGIVHYPTLTTGHASKMALGTQRPLTQGDAAHARGAVGKVCYVNALLLRDELATHRDFWEECL